MNAFLSSAAVKLNPLIGIVITLAGALVGGKLAGDAPQGILIGLIAGSAIAIGLCGSVAMLSTIVDAIEQPAAGASTGAAASASARPTASSSEPEPVIDQAAIRSASAAMINGDGTSGDDSELGRLIARGQFAQYHLVKGRKLLAEGKMKDAAYQAAASLAHEPGNSEARALRAAARRKQ